MKILDCSSANSVLSSFSSVLGQDECSIIQTLRSQHFCELINEPVEELGPCLREHLFGESEFDHFDKACWFHATRTWTDVTYEDGLLSLPDVIDSVWDRLWDFAKEYVRYVDWLSFRKDVESGQMGKFSGLYVHKVVNGATLGPCGFLIRETVFTPLHSKFFEVPEIIEDICNCFEKKSGKSTISSFQEATEPRLVKFLRDIQDVQHVEDACAYLFRSLHGVTSDFHVYDGTDCEGKSVPASDILLVEKLDAAILRNLEGLGYGG